MTRPTIPNIHIHINTAKTRKLIPFHLIQSFEPGEVDCEKAHAIGKQLADAATKGQHEYVLTTHIDKGHIHNHVIFCAVNFVDYHKYNSNKRSYYGIRNISDRL